MQNLTDEHTVFIKFYEANEQQIAECMETYIRELGAIVGHSIPCSFRVSFIRNKFGNSFGRGFIYVSNTEVFNALIGKNIDGTERVVQVQEPIVQAPKKELVPGTKLNWDELDDEDDETQRFITISKQLPPLLAFPPVFLTEEQKLKKLESIPESLREDTNIDIEYVDVSQCTTPPAEKGKISNILKCSTVPDWLTKEDLKGRAVFFTSDYLTKITCSVGGVDFRDSYPLIHITKGIDGTTKAFIIFDFRLNDGPFALCFMKRSFFTSPEGKETPVFFDFAFLEDKDFNVSVTQQGVLKTIFKRKEGKPYNKKPQQDVPTEIRMSPEYPLKEKFIPRKSYSSKSVSESPKLKIQESNTNDKSSSDTLVIKPFRCHNGRPNKYFKKFSSPKVPAKTGNRFEQLNDEDC